METFSEQKLRADVTACGDIIWRNWAKVEEFLSCLFEFVCWLSWKGLNIPENINELLYFCSVKFTAFLVLAIFHVQLNALIYLYCFPSPLPINCIHICSETKKKRVQSRWTNNPASYPGENKESYQMHSSLSINEV